MKIRPGNFQVSDRGVLEIAESEGVVPAPYYDSVNILTIFIGHTAFAGEPDPADFRMAMPTNIEPVITEAVRVLARDLETVERRINTWVKVPLAQHEIDALAHWDINCGGIWYRARSGTWKNARLIEAINAGEADPAQHFFGWLKPPELLGRRRKEAALFRTGNYDGNGTRIPIYRTNGRGRLILPAFSHIEGADLLKRMPRTRTTSVWMRLWQQFRKGLGI